MSDLSRYSLGGLVIHLSSPQVSLGGQPLRITPLEYRLLACLARRAGCPVSTAELLRAIWGCCGATGGSEALVRNCVKRLRRKIESDPENPRYLLNQHGWGYFLPLPDDDEQTVSS